MGLRKIGSGSNLPEKINVVIEIPSRSEPVKYEVDKDSGAMFVDRFMSTCMRYPCEYGYIPNTLAQDDDPVDVLVICPFPLITGSYISCRPIGILDMEDEKGHDSKLLAVPTEELTPLYKDAYTPEDLPPTLLNAIKHFFSHYKDLEEGKWVKINGWLGSDAAKKEIVESIERYKEYKKQK